MYLESKNNVANRYFVNRMRKIFVDRCVGIENFDQYLAHRYRTNCYFYSAYAIMGMLHTDFLVRGDITLADDWQWCDGGYGHGWVEFSFLGTEFVFDSACQNVVPKEEWYEKFKPENMIKITQKQILEKLIPSTHCFERGAFYQIRTETDDETDQNYLVKPFKDAVVFLKRDIIMRFIAYRDPFS